MLARYYVGWTAGDVDARLATHLQGAGSPLLRAAVGAGVEVQLVATYRGGRHFERRLKRWHKSRAVLRHLPRTPRRSRPLMLSHRPSGEGALARAVRLGPGVPRKVAASWHTCSPGRHRCAAAKAGLRLPTGLRARALIALTFRGSTQPV